MPFPHTSSGFSSRARKAKEKDKDVRQPGGTSRRLREPSRVTNSRVSPPKAQISLYNQQNETLEQLPALPSSGTTSPILALSPVLPVSQISSKHTGIAQFPHHFYTPTALQPYLEDDNDSATEKTAERAVDEAGKSLSTFGAREFWRPNELELVERKSPPVSGKGEIPLNAASCITSPSLAHRDPMVSHHQVTPKIFPSGQDCMVESNNWVSHESLSSFSPSTSYMNTQFLAPRYTIPYHYKMAQSGNHFGELHQMHVQPGSYFKSYGYHNPMPHHENEFASRGQHHGMLDSHLIAPKGLDAEMGVGAGYPSLYDTTQNDASDLIYRIQSTIPDLHLLVHRYQEASSQLQRREDDISRMEAQAAATLRQKEIQIDRLTKDLEAASQKHCTEKSKLRLEIGNLEENHKELQDSFIAGQSTRAHLEAELDAWKVQIETDNKLKKPILEQDLGGRTNNETITHCTMSGMSSEYLIDVDDRKSRWRREIGEQEAAHIKAMASLEAAFKACQADLEKTLRREQEGHESWKGEREALQKSWVQQREILVNEWEEERRSLLALHEHKTEEVAQRRLLAEQHEGYSLVEVGNENLRQQIERLRADWSADNIKHGKEAQGLKASLAKLESENGRLQKMIEAFGETTDIKS